jgi:hypothetical protein
MFNAWYELHIVNVIQVGRLSMVINLCGIMELMWNNGKKRLVVNVHGPFLSRKLR